MLNDWSHKVRAILKNIARAILKKYCPLCHKAGIHDFILATKRSVWIIITHNVKYHKSHNDPCVNGGQFVPTVYI